MGLMTVMHVHAYMLCYRGDGAVDVGLEGKSRRARFAEQEMLINAHALLER